MSDATADRRSRTGAERAIAAWLLVCLAMVFVMVVLGGATRLTHSGLSMVDWEPITGWLPPASEQAWQRAFERYQHYPEFQQLNRDMDLEGFKAIFWLEYIHRVWGRAIGVVFLVPFLAFWALGKIPPGLMPRLLAMFVLGALQGVMGWYMVMSGLVDRPDVSQYRLTAHLGLAFLIYAYILWVALGLLERPDADRRGGTGLRAAAAALVVLVSITVLSGGLVAGLDAGLAYNTFPLMGGRWIPQHILAMDPAVRNLFENIATVQFDHRVLAVLTLVSILAFWGLAGRRPVPAPARLAIHAAAAAVVVQFGLGLYTLLAVVPVPVAVAHQGGALVLFTAMIWMLHALR